MNSDRKFEQYMKKYSDTYITKRGKDKIWHLKTKYGQIEPYSFPINDNITLMSYCNFKTCGKKGAFKKRLNKHDYVEIIQDGDHELIFNFSEIYIKEIDDLIGITHRRITI